MTSEAKALYQQGNALRKQGLWDDAATCYQKAITLQPDYVEALGNLGITQKAQGKTDEAIATFQKALTIQPQAVPILSNLGITLKEKGQLPEAHACLQQAIEIMPDYAEGHTNLGNILERMGNLAKSLEHFRIAVALNPSMAVAHYNLANLLKQARKHDEAVTHYRRAIHFSPHVGEYYSNMGVTLKELGQLEAAESSHRHALSLKPKKPAWHRNLANSLKEQGRLSEALDAYRTAIRLRMEFWETIRPRPQEYMDIASAHTALLALKAALDAENIPFFLAYGTLLGIVRDGELLPHDKDMDVGLPWHISRAELVKCLTDKHGFLNPYSYRDTTASDEWCITLLHAKTGITVDLFFFKPEDDTLLSGIYHQPIPLLWQFSSFETTTLSFLGRQWDIPSPPERFLNEIYGPDWRNPDPYFDSLISGHNRLPEGLDVALCYAYNRLYERLDHGEWAKSAGYCRQITAYKPDPLIDTVLEWLQTRI